jgi:hypothetical protein
MPPVAQADSCGKTKCKRSCKQAEYGSCLEGIARPRAILSKNDAIAIFQMKGSSSSATQVAMPYGVSEKTIRDIWTGRCWGAATWHLDRSRVLKIKPSGRPPGRRDSRPRKHKRRKQESENGVSNGRAEQKPDVIAEKHPANKKNTLTRNISGNLSPLRADATVENKVFSLQTKKSVDEQLFDWEHNPQGSLLVDPFKEDWKRNSCVD